MKEFSELCMACMNYIGEKDVCPNCGYKQSSNSDYALQQGTIIEDRYKIGKDLDFDGEGIGYIAYDIETSSKVYIREFYPSNFCDRRGEYVTIKYNLKDKFEEYKTEFSNYFKSIAHLREFPGIVSIYNIVFQNNTVYVVYEWLSGINLIQFVERKGGKLNWSSISEMFMPIISTLIEMSNIGIHHYGISPENIIILPNGKMKLTGFAIYQLRKYGTDIEPKLYKGCSALEQYNPKDILDERTDIYGLSASIFFALIGSFPPSIESRKKNSRLMVNNKLLETIPEHVIYILVSGLQVYKNDRIRTFETFKKELTILAKVKEYNIINNKKHTENKKIPKYASWIITIIIVSAILLIYFLVYNLNKKNETIDNNEESNATFVSSNISELEKEDKLFVPNLIGKNYADVKKAYSALQDYQIIQTSEDFSDTISEGLILSQEPSYGSTVTRGSAIVVTVSKGAKMKKLPDIKGMTLSEASIALTKLKLIPESIFEYNDSIKEGIVIGYYNYKAGDSIEYGSRLKIIVSKGEQP